MKQMRWLIILLVIWLTFLFNIERLDYENASVVNLTSFVYALVAGTIGLLLLVPMRQRQMYLATAGILAIYVALKILLPVPVFQGVNKFVTITEIVALLITAALTWPISQALRDFVQAVEAISLPAERTGLLNYVKLQEHMQIEMSRARRHQRPISVAMIAVDPPTFETALHQAVRDAQSAMIERYLQVRFGIFMNRQIRETDRIAHDNETGRFLLVAPETSAVQTEELLKRLSYQIEEQLGIRFRYSVADFPSTALTAEEMIHHVAEHLNNQSMAGVSQTKDPRPEPAKPLLGADPYATASVSSGQPTGFEQGKGANYNNGADRAR